MQRAVRALRALRTLGAAHAADRRRVPHGSDLNSMIDISKVADLVLLLIDGAFGFEMETFEFLNMLQVHGFPKVMGVLTHLDGFRDNKKLRQTKKRIKARFWTEIYQGAKLFYLSGLIHGHYPKREIHNLSRFISTMKVRRAAAQRSRSRASLTGRRAVPTADVAQRASLCHHRSLRGHYGPGAGAAGPKGCPLQHAFAWR